MHILVVEDEPKVATFIKKSLEENNFSADLAYDGQVAERLILQYDYDLIILDVIIPHINGIELCRKIKAMKPSLPVLLLTALGTTDDKLTGFDAGADDYLVKPFEFRELLARIKAISKRSGGAAVPTSKLAVADLELDLEKKAAFRGGRYIQLTAKEFRLLEYFMRNKNRVLSRGELAADIWDIHFEMGTNVVDVYVNILRKKIDKGFDSKLIHTRFGMGYLFGEE